MRQEEEFMKKYADFKAGRITPKEWDNYCIKCLIALMEKNPNMVIKQAEGQPFAFAAP